MHLGCTTNKACVWYLDELTMGLYNDNMTEYFICCALIARCVKTGSAPPAVLPPALRASAEGADSCWSIDAAAAEKVQRALGRGTNPSPRTVSGTDDVDGAPVSESDVTIAL